MELNGLSRSSQRFTIGDLCRGTKPFLHSHTRMYSNSIYSNIEILERFQSIALRMIVDAPWYIPNTVIRRDIQA
jgi:hypothetical protein